MKHFLFSITLLFLSYLSFGQDGGFLKIFDSLTTSGLYDDVVNYHDTLVFYGIGWDETGAQGMRFYRVDTFGNILLSRIVTDSSGILTKTSGGRTAIRRTHDGGYVILGYSLGFNNGPSHPYLLKVTDSFEVVFKVFYDEPFAMAHEGVLELDDGFITLWAIGNYYNSIGNDILVIRTDENGHEIWRRQYGEFVFAETPGWISKLNDNQYVISGGISDYSAPSDYNWPNPTWKRSYMIAIDSSGELLWQWQSPQEDSTGYISKHIMLADSSWLMVGHRWQYIPDSNRYDSAAMLVKRDKNLNLIWKHYVGAIEGGIGTGFGRDLELTPDSNCVITGHAQMANEAYFSGFHYKSNLDGDSLWARVDTVLGVYDFTNLTGIEVLSSGSTITVGTTLGHTGYVGVLIKLTPDGCRDTLNCFAVANRNIKEEMDAKVYPNPAKEFVRFEYDSRWAQAKISIYDALGRKLLSKNITGGEPVDISFLPKGVYGYQLLSRTGLILGQGLFFKE